MIEKKQALIWGVFLGIGFYMIPSFVSALKAVKGVFSVIGMGIMAAGVIYFIAEDVILKGRGSSSGFSKHIKTKLKKGEITEEEALKLQKHELEHEFLLEKQKLEIAKKKAEIQKIKNDAKPKFNMGSLLGGDPKKEYKMPDVLGNLAPMFAGGPTEVVNPRDAIGEKKKKDQDDLRNLF